MEKILIYPYSKSYEPFVIHQKLIKNHRIESLVSPRGWGLEGDTINGAYGEITVSSNFTDELEKCTTVWFVEDGPFTLPEELLFAKLHDAINANKDIAYTRFYNSQQLEKACNLISKGRNVTFPTDSKCSDLLKQKKCYKIDSPVLVVFGLEENTDKFEVQVGLREALLSKDYRVSSITTRRDSDILGMHSIPTFMFDNKICEVDKIIQYNHFVKSIEIEEKPEIIIIGIPGGVIPFDEFNHNSYGVMAYEISNAIPCDSAIMCIPYYPNFTGNYSEISKDIMGKFGFCVDICHIAAVTIDTRTIMENFRRSFLTIKNEHVRKKILSCNKSEILDLTDSIGMSAAIDIIIDKLSSYC